MLVFTKYQKRPENIKVLLMHLLLNGFDLNQIECVEEIEESDKFGVKVRKTIGYTREFVDVKKIEQEIEALLSPMVCSLQTYQYYCNDPLIYAYEAKIPEKTICINDLSIVSQYMIIAKDQVVSSNLAEPLGKCNKMGFMSFFQYVVDEKCDIDRWHIEYHNREFAIYYKSIEQGTSRNICLFSAVAIDKGSTYKLVLYIISKASLVVEKWSPDNFSITEWVIK